MNSETRYEYSLPTEQGNKVISKGNDKTARKIWIREFRKKMKYQ